MSEEGGGPCLLAVDSSSEHCLVAVARGEELLAALEWRCPREHSRELLAAVSAVLERGHVEKRDLDAVAVVVGPGTYAGLRVGVSTAKGIAFALGVPILAVGRFEVEAAGLLRLGAPEVAVALEAGRGQVGLARYRLEEGEPVAVRGPDLVSRSDLGANGGPLAGDVPGLTSWRRRPEDLVYLALREWRRERRRPVEPAYLREASITKSTRRLI